MAITSQFVNMMSSPSFLEWLFYKIIGLKLNKDKCIFITDKLKFFGVEISNEGISPDKKKLKQLSMFYHQVILVN